jgi:methionyl-tRNA synthetase
MANVNKTFEDFVDMYNGICEKAFNDSNHSFNEAILKYYTANNKFKFIINIRNINPDIISNLGISQTALDTFIKLEKQEAERLYTIAKASIQYTIAKMEYTQTIIDNESIYMAAAKKASEAQSLHE